MALSIRELSPELAQKAKDELFEDPARIPQDIQAIKDWLAEQTHINARTDDQWLIAFLRGCKYNLQRAKGKIDLFYTMKSIAPEITVMTDPFDPETQELLKKGVLLPIIKNYKPDEPRYIIIRPSVMKADQISFIEYMRLGIMIDCINMIEDDKTVIAGVVFIADMAGLGFAHVIKVTPSLIKKMILTRQDAFPIRQKGVHHINFPSVAEKLFTLFKLFLNKKFKSRLFVHSNMDALHKVVPKSILPPEYGGEGDSVQFLIDYWKNKIESYKDYFMEGAKYKTDESKRPGEPKTSESYFGLTGFFRKPNFD